MNGYFEILSNKTRFITFDKKTRKLLQAYSICGHALLQYLSLLKFRINKDWNPNDGCYTVDYNLSIPLLLLVIAEQIFKWFRCNAF